MPLYIAEIESTVAGIPCIIAVTSYDDVAGSFSHYADSDMDFYGYTECEFDILDRKGYRAKWLEKKLDAKETDRINYIINEYMRG